MKEEIELVLENEELIENPLNDIENGDVIYPVMLDSEKKRYTFLLLEDISAQFSVTFLVEEELIDKKDYINDYNGIVNNEDDSEHPSEVSLDEETSDNPEEKNIEELSIHSEDNNNDVIEEETFPVNRCRDLRPKRPTTFDHRYVHTMAIMMTQMSVGKGLKIFGEKAADAITKEFTRLYEIGVLLLRKFNELTQEEINEVFPACTDQ